MIDIDLELIKVFSVVAEEGNITKGAARLFISQPAVSQCIKKLEEQLGSVLFLRSNKGLTLTQEGKVFLDYVNSALHLLGNAKTELNNYKKLQKGVLNIGASTTLTKQFLLQALHRFHAQYPLVTINIINDITAHLLLDLEKGKLDFVLLKQGTSEHKNFELTTLCTLNFGFYYNPKLLTVPSIINIQELSNLPLILQKNGSNNRAFLNSECARFGATLVPSMEVVSAELAIELANIGLGIVFASTAPSHFAKINLAQQLLPSKVLVATNKFFSLSFACKTFLDLLLKTQK